MSSELNGVDDRQSRIEGIRLQNAIKTWIEAEIQPKLKQFMVGVLEDFRNVGSNLTFRDRMTIAHSIEYLSNASEAKGLAIFFTSGNNKKIIDTVLAQYPLEPGERYRSTECLFAIALYGSKKGINTID